MHFITIVGILLITLGTILTYIGQNISNRQNTAKLTSTIEDKNNEIDELIEGKNKLLDQNDDLLIKIDQYQKDLNIKEAQIKKLEVSSKKASRGISSTYDFNGVKRETTRLGIMTVTNTGELTVFSKIIELEKQKKYNELIAICEAQIKKTPEWLTPYFYAGIAHANLGDKEKAIELFKHVVNKAPEDQDYAQAEIFLKRLREQ